MIVINTKVKRTLRVIAVFVCLYIVVFSFLAAVFSGFSIEDVGLLLFSIIGCVACIVGGCELNFAAIKLFFYILISAMILDLYFFISPMGFDVFYEASSPSNVLLATLLAKLLVYAYGMLMLVLQWKAQTNIRGLIK